MARQQEVAISTKLKEIYFEEWFRPEIVINALKETMNQSPKFAVFDAFVHNGIVWTHPNAIFSSVRKYAEMNGIIDIKLYLSSERPEMMATIFDKLRRAGYIHNSVRDNSIGYHCYINFYRYKDNKRKSIPSCGERLRAN
jgi:hypothetical protein